MWGWTRWAQQLGARRPGKAYCEPCGNAPLLLMAPMRQQPSARRSGGQIPDPRLWKQCSAATVPCAYSMHDSSAGAHLLQLDVHELAVLMNSMLRQGHLLQLPDHASSRLKKR